MTMRIALSLICVFCSWSFEAAAQAPTERPTERTTVIELFTSQGCSSCPNADALLKQYATRRDIVALTMPVDYWDYLGWRDTLASPKFTKRQRAYAKARGDGQIYTPQAIIDGRVHVNGASKTAIEQALADAGHRPRSTAVNAVLENGTITVEVSKPDPTSAESTLWLAVVQDVAEVAVKSGENGGRKLSYYNVVRDLVPLGMATAPVVIKESAAALSTGAGNRFAVLVQSGMGGPIVSAAWVAPPVAAHGAAGKAAGSNP